MLRAGNSLPRGAGNSGFTLFELLLVITIIAMTIAAVSVSYRTDPSTTGLKSLAYTMSSRLRDLRAAAVAHGAERVAEIDAGRRVVRFHDGRAPLSFDPSIGIKVTAADSERRSQSQTGIRFYPNGSSSGGTIRLNRKQQTYEIQIHWLSGRISTQALK